MRDGLLSTAALTSHWVCAKSPRKLPAVFAHISQRATVRRVEDLDLIEPPTRGFSNRCYEHFTFEASPSDPYHLLLIMKDLLQIISA